MGEILERRRAEAASRFAALKTRLEGTEAARNAKDKACVYVTGSFGRQEASSHSDLDLFVAGHGTEKERKLSRLDEICLKAELIAATRAARIPEFSGDGDYLQHYTVYELGKSLGTPTDDATNTFTARLLLLLESRPLIGEGVYDAAVTEMLEKYWRDYERHESDFMPTFLANDILRLWRTFCVNYEARTATDPAEKKAKRKLKNYKLKHSRMLTCYSALAYLLSVHRSKDTVTPGDAFAMVKLTPTERLEFLEASPGLDPAKENLRRLLELYEKFLEVTDAPEAELIRQFMDPEVNRERVLAARSFGDEMFALLQNLGEDESFYRLLVV